MADHHKVNTAFVFAFMVYDTDQLTPKDGILPGSFVTQLEKDGVMNGATITITEVDAINFKGLYHASVTPNATGYWAGRITEPTYLKRGELFDLVVGDRDIPDLARQSDVVSAATIAAAILSNPANKLLTDGAGRVTTAAFAAGAITASAFATGALTASALAVDFANKLTDIIWRRNYANIRGSAFGDTLLLKSPLGAVAKLVNKFENNANTLNIYHDNGVLFGTQIATSSPTAQPIISVN